MLFLFANRLRQALKVNRNQAASKPQLLVDVKSDSKQVRFHQTQSVMLMKFVFFATPLGAIKSPLNLRSTTGIKPYLNTKSKYHLNDRGNK